MTFEDPGRFHSQHLSSTVQGFRREQLTPQHPNQHHGTDMGMPAAAMATLDPYGLASSGDEL
jgi:hypothetical protein